MPLIVYTGPVRSGKSAAAVEAARVSGLPVVVAVAGAPDDDEMLSRIERHVRSRPREWTVLEVAGVPVDEWLATVPPDVCLLVDCFGTMLSAIAWGGHAEGQHHPDAADVERQAAGIAHSLAARNGTTIVVTNEVGWGVVPPTPAGRAFQDAVGAANRILVNAADEAFLVVCGRMIDLRMLPKAPRRD